MKDFTTSVFYGKLQKPFASYQIPWQLNILILEDFFVTLCYRKGHHRLKTCFESSQ